MSSSRVAAIVPAFNEAPTIGAVVATLMASSLIQEVIVVSDGSTDATAVCARAAGAQVYEIPNSGKGAAMQFGLAQTQAEIILFCDADLRGFTTQHIEQLLHPVLSGARVMNVGLRDKGFLLNQCIKHLPLIGGERALQHSVIDAIPAQQLTGFMVESVLNAYCRAHGLPYGGVLLPGLSMRRKFEKVGWGKAIRQYVRMSGQVIRAMIRGWLGYFLKNK